MMASTDSRILSLDIFRGLTIAGMIVVNDPGTWGHIYAPLRHAPWHGITPTDMVFPFFIFIVGISTVLSLSRRKEAGHEIASLAGKILWRTCIIFALGLFMWLFPKFDWSAIRIPGVLQRIAIVYAACALLYIGTSWKTQLGIASVFLIGYCAVLQTVPVPIDDTIAAAIQTGEVATASGTTAVTPEPLNSSAEGGMIAANLQPGTNLAAWVDRRTTPGRLWEKTWDPEGLLSTLPAIANGIIGMLLGQLILWRKEPEARCNLLMAAGFGLFIAGSVWAWSFPLNKNLWSSSFVLYTAGLASLSFGFLYWIIDVNKQVAWAYPFRVFGANAIAAFVLHGLIARLLAIPIGKNEWTFKAWYMEACGTSGLPLEAVSLSYALLYTFLIFLIVWAMYLRKIFLRV